MIEKTVNLKTKVVVFILITIVNILLARFAALATPNIPGADTLYFAVAFMIPFALWFGAWGAIAAYIGCIVGSGLAAGFSVPVNFSWSLADLWQVLIPLLAFKALSGDISLKNRRDIGLFVVFGWIFNNLAGAIWGTFILIISGYVYPADFLMPFITWFISNLLVTSLITPILLKVFTPILQRKGLIIKNYW